jgi:hypothetical protein
MSATVNDMRRMLRVDVLLRETVAIFQVQPIATQLAVVALTNVTSITNKHWLLLLMTHLDLI